jgi:hypothetical protein
MDEEQGSLKEENSSSLKAREFLKTTSQKLSNNPLAPVPRMVIKANDPLATREPNSLIFGLSTAAQTIAHQLVQNNG